jgi:diketogulonate reductase-like aldo/keto reductase
MIERKIPSTGETVPVIGLGSWQTFDVSPSSNLEPLKQVLSAMSTAGGSVIDSSPMYGRSEEIIGVLTSNDPIGKYFYATKVWTQGKQEGIKQMENSFRKIQRPVIDLMQIHNLVDWEIHLKTLRDWKEEGKIRYIGITHYTDSRHDQLVEIIKAEKIDFVQFNYSIAHRNAEKGLLPTANEYGVATLINRPFGEGNLFRQVKEKQLPAWAAEFNIKNWSQFFLKFIISNPAVTCVIPATSDSSHASDNFEAGIEPLPNDSVRKKMIEWFKKL